MRMPTKFSRTAFFSTGLAVLALMATSCGFGSTSPTTTGSGATTTQAPATSQPSTTTTQPSISVTAYFVKDTHLYSVIRHPKYTIAVATAAMKELLGGPSKKEAALGLSSAIPVGTTLNGITVTNGTATVDLSSAYESGGGSTSMLLRLAQVTYTLTQFPTVDNVVFRIDGTVVTVFGGEGILLEQPQTRADYYDNTLPPIFVDTPPAFSDVTSPIMASGVANVFEAQFRIALLNSQGTKIYDAGVTASAGTGTWGTWSASIPYSSQTAGAVTLRVYDLSAKDGSVIDVVDVPLTAA